MTAVEARRAICVLGMHRSGTSAIASLLEGLGVHLGEPGDLLDPLPENPRGYWEHRALKDVNDELLARFGGRWHAPPAWRDGWEQTTALEQLREQARALLHDRFGTFALWGWKDPRTCLTLPFWLPLLPDARFILCLRNPLDVARSLQARDDLPLAHGLRLWLTYTAAALTHSAGRPRLLLFYEDVIDAPVAAAARLATFIGCPPISQEAVAALVAPDLRHHATSLETAIDHPECSRAVRSLYVTLRSLRSEQREPGPEVDARLSAAATSAIETQAALDAARGEKSWLVASAPAQIVRRSPDVSAVRVRARRYFSTHQSQAIAYRRVRRVVRRWLRLGP